MGFDFIKYKAEDWQFRTEDVEVPELKDFFEKGEKPIWKVRNLKAIEIAQMNEVLDKNYAGIVGKIETLFHGWDKNARKLIDETIDIMNDTVPNVLVRQYETVLRGTISPSPETFGKPDLIYLGEHHALVLKRISDKILILSGQGSMPGKQKPCGATKKSKTV